MYYTYVIYSKTADQFYIGYTSNIEGRLVKHNYGATLSTKKGIPWEMKYFETFSTKKEAIVRERKLKKLKSRKYLEQLISSENG
jgi:putative endonuclease